MSKSLLCGSLSLAAPHCARGVGTHSYINLLAPFPIFPSTYLWLVNRSFPTLVLLPACLCPLTRLIFPSEIHTKFQCVCMPGVGFSGSAIASAYSVFFFFFFKLHECLQNGDALVLYAQVKKQSITRTPGLPLDTFSHFLSLNSWLPRILTSNRFILPLLSYTAYSFVSVFLCSTMFVKFIQVVWS